MCVGVPECVVSCDGVAGTMESGRIIDMSLTGAVPQGTWVLTHLGAAREILDAEEARLITAALEGLGQVMAGRDVGNAFADLDARAPSLPPHLEAARVAGKTTA